ncbi:MAG: hypothetical protein HY521_10870 [Proteobacteria bacterium]|nr:hypothetical protein [Pseudomonadota bacterium]
MRKWLARTLRRLAVALGGESEGPRAPRYRPAGASVEEALLEQRLSLAHFARRLESDLKHPLKQGSGNLQLIRLDAVRELLGERWQEIADRAFHMAEQVIRTRLAQTDVYVRYDDTSFLVLFSSLSETAARVKANAITQEIRARLIGKTDEPPTVRVKSALVPVDSLATPDAGLSLNQLNRAFDEQTRTVEPEVAAAAAAILGGDPLAELRPMAPQEVMGAIRISYRPTWSQRQRLVTLYAAYPRRQDARGDWYAGEEVFPRGGQGSITLDFDCAILRVALDDLTRMARAQHAALVSVAVHHGSLTAGTRDRILAVLRRADEPERRRLVVEIAGITPSTASGHLAEAIAAVKPFARAVLVRSALRERNFKDFVGFGVHAVGVDLCESANARLTGDDLLDSLVEFATRAGTFGFSTYVWGADSYEIALNAARSGFSYINGTAIAGEVSRPGSHYPLDPFGAGEPIGLSG